MDRNGILINMLKELESINRLLTQSLAQQLPEHPTVEELFEWTPDDL